jgi:hypothetical protein
MQAFAACAGTLGAMNMWIGYPVVSLRSTIGYGL